MERNELGTADARRNGVRHSPYEAALVDTYIYQAETVLRLARNVAERARRVRTALANMYVRGLAAKGDLLDKNIGNLP